MSRYGQYHVAETPSSLMRLHFHSGGALKEVDHEPKVGVLDQQDLLKQGIRVSEFIPGAKDVDALGSCTANGTTAAVSNILSEAAFLGLTKAKSYQDVVAAEKWAIGFYHACSDQTGNPAQEWPPTDCGSSGPYIVQMLEHLKLIRSDRIAHGAQNIVSLMQTDGLLAGFPFMNIWEQPDADAFIDGNGTAEDLQQAIRLGVAGGHETYLSAIEKLTVSATGQVDPFNTVIRARNSWSPTWGDHGSYRVHLSTLAMLGNHADFRQLVAA